MPNLKDKLATTGGDQASGPPTIAALIKNQQAEIAAALPNTGITPERFTRIVLTEIRKNPKLAQCDPHSLLGSMMVAAQLGLEVGGHLGQGYLVPYGRECTLIIGYRGIIDLARRSGEITSIVARPVHEGDEFDYAYGLEETLTHRPAIGERGPVVCYYGIAKFRDGGHLLHVMAKGDIDARRARSKASKSGPWVTDYDSMACKTVIRAMSPFLPLRSEDQRAVALDEVRGPTRIDFDLEELIEAPDENVDPEVVDAEIVPPVDENGELPLDPGRPFDDAS